MSLLKVENLTKVYAKRAVVNHVSYYVNAGEIVGLLGPNGAGKTTTFRMTVGMVTPTGGTVVFAGTQGGLGKTLVIDHGNNVKTFYSHLSEMFVRVGDSVNRRQVIAALGNTGRSTGPHLHYEVRVNGIPEDPRKFILD